MNQYEISEVFYKLNQECRRIIEEVKETRGPSPEAVMMLLGITRLSDAGEHLCDILSIMAEDSTRKEKVSVPFNLFMGNDIES